MTMATRNNTSDDGIPINIDLSEVQDQNDELCVEVEDCQIEEEKPCFDEITTDGLRLVNQALDNFLSLSEEDVRREIDAALVAAGGATPKKKLPPPLPAPRRAAGGGSPQR